VIICKNVNYSLYIKIRMENNCQYEKKGGISILTKREKEILNREKEISFPNRLFYPLVFSETLGVIYIKRGPPNGPFTELEKKWFFSLSEEISVGLKIFNLYREEKKMIISYVKSLTKLLDQYVPTSYLHTKNIFRFIRMLGKAMKLSEAEIKSLEYASLLHDAGKIQLPSAILKKQRPLTDEEFKIIRKHPREGVELIKDLDILKPVIPIILHHHERYDGSGYPSRLKKEQIPIGSRILSIIDAFDAMYFGRPYRKKIPLPEIEQEIKKESAKQFDPKIVDIFLKILRRKATPKELRFSK